MSGTSLQYAEMLAATEPSRLGTPSPDSEAYQQGLARFRTFFADMTPERVAAQVESVYGNEAILHDTVVTHRGIIDIKRYFLKTAARAKGVRVEIDQVVTEGYDTYVRWTMDIDWKGLNGGRTTRSVGLSHLRFDAEGKVALHHDFWDSATGLYQYIPVLGPLLRWVRAKFGQS